MFFQDLSALVHYSKIDTKSILIYNSSSINYSFIIAISKIFNNVFISFDNSFYLTNTKHQFKNIQNIHVIDEFQIPIYFYNIVYTTGIFQDIVTFLQKYPQNYSYFYPQCQCSIKFNNIEKYYFNFLIHKLNIPTNQFITNNQNNKTNKLKIDLLTNEASVRTSFQNYNITSIKSYNTYNKSIQKIAIIIPTYNQSQFTIKCFKSINKYTTKNYDIHIYWIDNGSTKKQISNVKNIITTLKNITIHQILQKKQLGYVKATNKGITEALKNNPDFIILQNNDTEVTQNWLTPLILPFKTDRNIMATGPLTNSKLAIQGYQKVKNNFISNMIDLSSFSTEQAAKQLHQTFPDEYVLISKRDVFTPAFFCTVLKPDIFKIIGLLDENFGMGYGDDVDFFFRLFDKGFSCAFVPESYVLHNHRTTFSSIMSMEQIQNTIKARLDQIYISNELNKNKSKKGVIYTCIINNYDQLKSPSIIDTINFDYICFSNQPINVPEPWKVIYIQSFEKYLNVDSTKLARFFKTNPHLFFKNYQYSIWIDGNIDILKNPNQLLSLLPYNEFLFTTKHPLRNCIYEQSIACIQRNKDSQENINNTIKFLEKQKYPKDNGLIQSGLLIRKHNEKSCKQLMNLWWDMINKFSKRDQLSFNYACWKLKLSYSYLPWNQLNQNYIKLNTFKHTKSSN